MRLLTHFRLFNTAHPFGWAVFVSTAQEAAPPRKEPKKLYIFLTGTIFAARIFHQNDLDF